MKDDFPDNGFDRLEKVEREIDRLHFRTKATEKMAVITNRFLIVNMVALGVLLILSIVKIIGVEV